MTDVAPAALLACVAMAIGIHLLVVFAEGMRRATAVGGVLATVAGWLAIVLIVDLMAGSVLAAIDDPNERATQQAATTIDGQIPRDPRADSPAYADSPWAEDYLDELNQPRYEYEPFLISRLRPSEGRYINTGDGFRESYQPDGADGPDALEVWFFGGSTMFGEGQRDEHTIPSEFARLAEGDGITIRPVNFGHQGQLLWQEMLRFEAELVRRGPPDLAVFYDGTNDYNYQLVDGTGQPTHGALEAVTEQLGPGEGGAQPLPRDGISAASLWDRYSDQSIMARVGGRVRNLLAFAPAGAQEGGDAEDGLLTPAELAARVEGNVDLTLESYRRSLEMAQLVASRHDVPAHFFWQPIRAETTEYLAVAHGLPNDVVDLTGLLNDVTEPIFIDGGHTNELGALLVAQGLYSTLETELRPAAAGGAP